MLRRPSNSTPSSLYHYTTAEVLLHLFYPILENQGENNSTLTFRASESGCMNDTQENKIITSNLGSQSKSLTDAFSELKKQLSKVYIISLSKERNFIPMWKMYGGNGDGIALRFDFKELKKSFSLIEMGNIDNLNFNLTTKYIISCKYITKDDLENISKKYREFFKDNQSNPTTLVNTFNRWQLEAISFKHQSFQYENEYRIIAFSQTSSFQQGSYGLKEYCEIKIPLSALEEILISPLCKMDTKRTIDSICRQIEFQTGKKINDTASRLSLR